MLGCFIEGYVSSDQALAKEADFGKLTRGALEFARGTFVTCSEEHNWYEHFQLLNAASRNSCWGTDRRMASLPASRGSLHYLVRLKKLTNGHQTMDKVADFYNRWFATRRIPDYSGVQAASEELAKQLLGVYESNKRDFWQSCAVKFLCGTLLHLCTQAHLYGKERMTLREVIAFIEAEPIEKSWKELMASQATDESITRIMAGAGELMLESPPPVARAILVTVFSRLSEEARAA